MATHSDPLHDMAGPKLVRELVAKYCAEERHTKWPALDILGPFTERGVWERKPEINGAGTYVIYGENGSLRYVGMSQSNIGRRIWSHFSAPIQAIEFWTNGSRARYIDLIPVKRSWEAASLEAYLIEMTLPKKA